MYERELHMAYQTALVMEERLTPEVTGKHEIYFDHAVSDDGKPFVAIAVSGRDGVEKLSRLFGDVIKFQGSASRSETSVAIHIRELKPQQALN